MAPLRALPSQYIPRLSSLVFHSKEMLYGVGLPDGTGKFFLFAPIHVYNGIYPIPLVRIMGCKLPEPEFPLA